MQHRRPKKKAKSKTGSAKRTRNLTIKAIAEGIGVSTVTIDKYVKRGCPRNSIEAVQKWRAQNIKAVAEETEDSDLGIEFRRAELIDKLESARTRQMKNDLMADTLVSKDAMRQLHGRLLSRLTNRFNAFGSECANFCPAELKAPIKERIEDGVRTALREVANELLLGR